MELCCSLEKENIQGEYTYTLFKYFTTTELIKIQLLNERDYNVTVVLFYK